MTEQEYIDTTNLGKVRCLMASLEEVHAQREGAIPSDEYVKVYQLVADWQDRLFAKANTSEDDEDDEAAS